MFYGLALAIANGGASLHRTINPAYKPAGLILSACGGGGGSSSFVGSPADVARYAFVANESDSSISSYVVDADTGRLRYIGKAMTGTQPISVTIDPASKYVYVANQGSDNVSQYIIGTDGSLTTMSTATVAAGANPAAITLDPSGKYAYVANLSRGGISQYTIGNDGSLTAMQPGIAVAQRRPDSLSISQGTAAVQALPQYAYVANRNSNSCVAIHHRYRWQAVSHAHSHSECGFKS